MDVGSEGNSWVGGTGEEGRSEVSFDPTHRPAGAKAVAGHGRYSRCDYVVKVVELSGPAKGRIRSRVVGRRWVLASTSSVV